MASICHPFQPIVSEDQIEIFREYLNFRQTRIVMNCTYRSISLADLYFNDISILLR